MLTSSIPQKVVRFTKLAVPCSSVWRDHTLGQYLIVSQHVILLSILPRRFYLVCSYLLFSGTFLDQLLFQTVLNHAGFELILLTPFLLLNNNIARSVR